MADKIVKMCDVCATDETETPGQQVSFFVKGQPYKVDLCDTHKAAFDKAEAAYARATGQFVKVGEKVAEVPAAAPTTRRPGAGRKPQTKEQKEENAAAKAWAIAEGKVPAGHTAQVKASIVDEWRAAGSPKAANAEAAA